MDNSVVSMILAYNGIYVWCSKVLQLTLMHVSDGSRVSWRKSSVLNRGICYSRRCFPIYLRHSVAQLHGWGKAARSHLKFAYTIVYNLYQLIYYYCYFCSRKLEASRLCTNLIRIRSTVGVASKHLLSVKSAHEGD